MICLSGGFISERVKWDNDSTMELACSGQAHCLTLPALPKSLLFFALCINNLCVPVLV